MADITVENILIQIAQLPPKERRKLRQILEREERQEKPPLDKRVPPIPMPDGKLEMQWLREHRREYIGQWIALDGDRLIAHDTDHQKVYAAAKSDGAYLPLITFIEDPDKHYLAL